MEDVEEVLTDAGTSKEHCAVRSMVETIETYRSTLPKATIHLSLLRCIISEAAASFARGTMNDASELFEFLINLCDRDFVWHMEHGGECSLTTSFNNPSDRLSFLAKAVGLVIQKNVF